MPVDPQAPHLHNKRLDLAARLLDIKACDEERVIPLARLARQFPGVLSNAHGLRKLDTTKLRRKQRSHGARNRSPQQPVAQLEEGAAEKHAAPMSELLQLFARLGDGLEQPVGPSCDACRCLPSPAIRL